VDFLAERGKKDVTPVSEKTAGRTSGDDLRIETGSSANARAAARHRSLRGLGGAGDAGSNPLGWGRFDTDPCAALPLSPAPSCHDES
jgi:hypothetical protein